MYSSVAIQDFLCTLLYQYPLLPSSLILDDVICVHEPEEARATFSAFDISHSRQKTPPVPRQTRTKCCDLEL